MAFSIAFYTSLKNKIQGDADNQCKVVFDFIKKITYLKISYLLLYTYCWAINNHQIVYGFSCFLDYDKEPTAGEIGTLFVMATFHLKEQNVKLSERIK